MGNLDELTRQEQEAINEISELFAMRDIEFKRWSEKIFTATAKRLKEMVEVAKLLLASLVASPDANPDDIAKATAAVKLLERALAQAESKSESSETTWTDLNGVLQDSASVFTELGEKIPGVAGEILSGIGNIATSAVSMANAIKGIGEAASAAEKASAILAVIGNMLRLLNKYRLIPDLRNMIPYLARMHLARCWNRRILQKMR